MNRPAVILALPIAAGLLAACGSSPRPDAIGPVGPPAAGPPPPSEVAGQPGVRQVLVGEMCPRAAGGRPAVRPLFVRGQTWTDRREAVSAPVERRGARQFSVLGWEGRRAGLFSIAGAAELDGGAAAIGAYAGRSPCEKPRGAGRAGERDPDCLAALRECGVAVAVIEPAGGFHARPVEEDPDPVDLEVGGACVADGKLLVDIDADGAPEAYPVGGFVDTAGAPSGEVVSVPPGGATCTARFAARATPGDADSSFDILGVADLDADGRHEIVASFRRGERRTWAIYQAGGSVARLDRVATATPWP